MIIEEVVSFLSKVPPFQFLDNKTLNESVKDFLVEYYPKGTTILHQDGPPSEYLMVIKKGGAKVFIVTGDGKEVLVDFRGEGDVIGFLSLYSADRSRANVVAIEDTICYLISRERVLDITEKNPAVREFFHKSFLNKYMDKTFHEMHGKSLMFGGGDKPFFTTPVGEIIAREAVTASQDITIREAAEIMSVNGISSLVLTDLHCVPVGIVTDRDLRDKVVAKSMDVEDSISRIMSVALIKSDASDYCFEALLKMIHFNIHHLLVVADGRLKGVISNHDLMMLKGSSPISLAREIESQHTVEGLIPVSKKISPMIAILLKEGARACNIIRIISEINDRLVRKILEIAEKKFGQPPLSYCWIVFGSEGRKEQTFKTDQDNAIIYDDPREGDDEEAIKKYFSAFSSFVIDSLLVCGFPVCPAKYMANNPQWCQPIKVWKKYFAEWVYSPTPEAVLKSLILFDFRAIHGDVTLAASLRDFLRTTLDGQMIFLGYMANMIVKNAPPVGFFKSFIVEKDGVHKDLLNLKVKGIAMFVDMVRLFSLEKGIKETSTTERISALRTRHTILNDYADEIEHAFEFIMLLRIQHQYGQIEAGLEPDNFIDPNSLSNLEKKTLKDAFSLISKLQDILVERYKPLIW